MNEELLTHALAAVIAKQEPIWLPHLTQKLVEARESRAISTEFPSCETYTTSSYLFGNLSIPRKIFFAEPEDSDFPQFRIELLNSKTEKYFGNMGLRFAPLSDANVDALISLICHASAFICAAPRLGRSIKMLVRSLHILSTDNPLYDVSYSHPQVPFSIFITAASYDTEGALRMAEAIIHEAMHLQLSLLEQNVSIAAETETVLFSPWKQEKRMVDGLIHAAYVFCVIDQWLSEIERYPETANYASRRRLQILQEFSGIDIFHCSEAATDFGKIVLKAIISQFD